MSCANMCVFSCLLNLEHRILMTHTDTHTHTHDARAWLFCSVLYTANRLAESPQVQLYQDALRVSARMQLLAASCLRVCVCV